MGFDVRNLRPAPSRHHRTEIAWTCAFADPLRFGQLLVVAAQDRMEPESQIASTNASIPPLDAWHMDSDAAARSAARQSPAVARPLALRQDYVVYAFYRPHPTTPPPGSSPVPNPPTRASDSFVALVFVVNASTESSPPAAGQTCLQPLTPPRAP